MSAKVPQLDITPALREAAERSKAWPFEEARKIVQRLPSLKSPVKQIVFETGYGPSGLPHIDTFGEIARTNLEFLEWLDRMPIGRPYRDEIDTILRQVGRRRSAKPDETDRRGLFRRR